MVITIDDSDNDVRNKEEEYNMCKGQRWCISTSFNSVPSVGACWKIWWQRLSLLSQPLKEQFLGDHGPSQETVPTGWHTHWALSQGHWTMQYDWCPHCPGLMGPTENKTFSKDIKSTY